MKSVAVVLCGSGYLDGSEIRESVATLWALSHHPVRVQCFAPDRPQADVMNCAIKRPMTGESRNLLVEAARIARGEIRSTTKLFPAEFNAIIFPGGFGVAKNLCTFAMEGSKGSVLPEIRDTIHSFYEAKKTIGAICIAPALIALALPNKKLTLTLGPNGEASQEIEKLGHRHAPAAPDEIVIDAENRIVSTPAYMYESAPLHQIFDGIRQLVDAVVAL